MVPLPFTQTKEIGLGDIAVCSQVAEPKCLMLTGCRYAVKQRLPAALALLLALVLKVLSTKAKALG